MLEVKNIFDVYGELGIKSVAIDGMLIHFQKMILKTHFIGGLRFGDSNNWEGKILLTILKNLNCYLSQT